VSTKGEFSQHSTVLYTQPHFALIFVRSLRIARGAAKLSITQRLIAVRESSPMTNRVPASDPEEAVSRPTQRQLLSRTV